MNGAAAPTAILTVCVVHLPICSGVKSFPVKSDESQVLLNGIQAFHYLPRLCKKAELCIKYTVNPLLPFSFLFPTDSTNISLELPRTYSSPVSSLLLLFFSDE